MQITNEPQYIQDVKKHIPDAVCIKIDTRFGTEYGIFRQSEIDSVGQRLANLQGPMDKQPQMAWIKAALTLNKRKRK